MVGNAYIERGVLEMRGHIWSPGKRKSPISVIIREPVLNGSIMGAQIEAYPVLEQPVDIFADTAVHAFDLACQFVWGAVGDRLLSLDLVRDEGWSDAFRDQRAELSGVAKEISDEQVCTTWQTPAGETVLTKISSPKYLERCEHWAVKIDAPALVTVPMAVTWLDAEGAVETADKFVARIAQHRGFVRKNDGAIFSP